MPEKRIIAFCGRICDTCLAYIAKKTNNNNLRKKAVKEWTSEKFSFEIEDINCDGCTNDKELLTYCTVCKVRKCGLEKELENCAYCADYPCKTLERVWNHLLFPHAQEVLDTIREKRESLQESSNP